MRRVASVRFAVGLFAALLVATAMSWVTTVPASAASGAEPCTSNADVAWNTDVARTAVTGAIVRVPGCPDGARVGLQVKTAGGDITTTTVGLVDDEEAVIDLARFGLQMEPVVGVRVLLYDESSGPGADDVPPTQDEDGSLPGTGTWITVSMLLGAAAAVALGSGLARLGRRRRGISAG